jgi:FG-GAP repeat
MRVCRVNFLLSGQDISLIPVTVSLKDVNGDGKPDLIVNIQQSHFVFLNQKVNGVWQFVPAPNQQQ